MTHTLKTTDLLPIDFFIRSAYMRLYSAYTHRDAYWPANVFGDEISVLLGRCHAESSGAGYRLTAAGVAQWEAYTLQWEKGTMATYTRGKLSHYIRLLLALQDGLWHGTTDLSEGYSRSYSFEVCERLVRDGYAEGRLISKHPHT